MITSQRTLYSTPGMEELRKALHERQAYLDLEVARLKEQLGNDRGTRSCGALTVANWLSLVVLYWPKTLRLWS